MPRTYFITYHSGREVHSSVATLPDIARIITGNHPFSSLRTWLIWNDGNISPVEIQHMKISSGSDSPIFIWASDFYGNTMEETMIQPG